MPKINSHQYGQFSDLFEDQTCFSARERRKYK